MRTLENLDVWSGGGWWVFIALNHQTTVGAGCCQWAHRTVWCATGQCPVRQPRHPIVRVLELSTVWCRTGQALFSVRCALTLPRIVAHCSARQEPLQSSAALDSHCLTGAPDSPVAHRTIWWIIAESAWRSPRVASWTLYGPGAPDSPVRQTRAHLVSLLLCIWTLSLIFYWFVLNLYAPIDHIL
jgi:hypothetical protein